MAFKKIYDELWTSAMQEAIINCCLLSEEPSAMKRKSEKLLTVCGLWREISKSIGKPHKVKNTYTNLNE